MHNLPNIAIDIGNSRIKSAEFHGDQISHVRQWDSIAELKQYIPENNKVIICSVSHTGTELKKLFDDFQPFVFQVSSKVPIGLEYKTPETLGLDRIAAAVGADHLFRGPSLVIDMGTCITYDLIIDGVFKGGAIAPGFTMRMKSMNKFTKGLPDVSGTWKEHDTGFPGKSTSESLICGSKEAIGHEMKGFIDHLRAENEDLNVILTGGDVQYFESIIKAPIFVRPNLVLTGLNRILIYNEAV